MSDETVFREVDEALRHDRLNSAWRRFGPYVIAAAVLVVLVVAANEGWNWWQQTNAARSSDQFYAALDAENGGKTADALKALDTVIAQGTGQYPVLAKFKQASLLAKQGDRDKALAAYDALATNAPNQQLKEIALLLGGELLVDKGDVAGVKQRLQGLAAPNNPLHDSALEAIGLAQYKAGDLKGAQQTFETVLNDPAASGEVHSRVQLYVGQLAAQGAGTPGGAAAAGGGTPAASDSSAATPAANDNAAGETAPAGVESSQPATPDSALDLAVPSAPAPPADTTAPGTAAQGLGTGLPTLPTETAPATEPATAPAAGAAAAPAQPGNATPAPAQTPPASGTTGQ